MDIQLLTVGKTTIPFVKEGIAEYEKRLRRYVPFQIQELPDVKGNAKRTEQSQKEAEGRLIAEKLTASDYLWLLDERGREYTSVEFADELQRLMASGLKRVVLAVGGPYGFSQEVYERANAKISLSRMTFNHEMVRLFFAEQLYRAMTILRGEPYHHR